VQIAREIEALWEVRRREKAGETEGLDLLADRPFADLCGENYLDALKPQKVDEPEKVPLDAAA